MQLDLLDSESDIKSFYSDDKRVRNINTSHRQSSDLRSVVAKDDHRMNGHYGLLGYSPADCHLGTSVAVKRVLWVFMRVDHNFSL